ncbi:MAG: hypothetical protein A2231_10560 [Candidatus Firestonebacteria bacterium RIFOXYA2_FULL_40_8]|nr:MAG: hypothetical protein A2231_10560 [Candidatus Firestonebacteria bacterium RIFOXYA2_FULL_40_8]
MSDENREKEVLACLKKKQEGIVSNRDEKTGLIRSRVMYYGVDESFVGYLMSVKDSPKVENILVSPGITMIVFGMEEPFDLSWEIEINGTAQLLTKDKDIMTALQTLKGRNPFADVAFESGITSRFDFIRLTPKFVMYRVYKEALNSEPPFLLKF